MLLALSCITIHAQECTCPDGINNDNEGQPFRVFSFSNGKQLGICGYQSIELSDTVFTKFTLFVCGENKATREWSDKKSCRVNKVKDTLFIKEMAGLPLGQSFSNLWIPFYVHKLYFKNGVLQDVEYFRKDIQKYGKAQIDLVMQEYKQLAPGSGGSAIRVAKMLFWAYASGSKEAGEYLNTLPDKFGPFESAVAEEISDVMALCANWKEKNSGK